MAVVRTRCNTADSTDGARQSADERGGGAFDPGSGTAKARRGRPRDGRGARADRVGPRERTVTAEEIALAFDDYDLETGQLDELYQAFEEQQVEIVSAAAAESTTSLAEAAIEVVDGLAAAVPQGHRPRRAAHGGAGGRAREAHRARRPSREAGDDRGEPAPRRLDREALPQPGPALPRSDPGGHDRPRPRRREVRLPQGLQVLDVRDVVDPPGGRARARRQGADDSHARPRRREAQQDRAFGAQASRRARPRADGCRDRARSRPVAGRGGADPPQLADAGLAREAGRRRGGVGVRALHHRRERAASRRGRGDDAPARDAREAAAQALGARAPGADPPLRARRQASAHARRGRAHVQRDARAHPADREPDAEEAPRARGRADPARRRCSRRRARAV